MKTAPVAHAPSAPSVMLDVSTMPAEQAVAKLIEHAVAMGSSDLFFCAADGHFAIQVRHLGLVRPISIVTPEEGKRMVAYIRSNSGADVNERRKPSDGRWIYRRDNDEDDVVDLRINFIPTIYGDDVAVRLLVRGQAIHKLDQIGMLPQQYSNYLQMIEAPSGLILITGPTGSGKTGSLYASLLHLHEGTSDVGRRKINTIEDPVEYAVDGFHQSQVNSAIGLGFAELLRAVLRQSPDVIMVGEVRDEETAVTAVRAANSGLLVFATLHAPDTASAVQSMRALGVPSHFLASSLRGIMSQRLLRTLDPESRVSFDLTDAPETFEEIREFLLPGEGTKLYAHGPTPANGMTGYTGRTGVFEILNATRTIKQLIADGASAAQLRSQAIADKMLQFRQAALIKVARGVTSTEEIFRMIPNEQLLSD